MAREHCLQCHYPVKTCVCYAVAATIHETKIIVLQHPDEVKNAKNTVRLAALSCNNIDIIVGESADDFESVRQSTEHGHSALLFPAENSGQYNLTADTTIRQLIIIDGTWRKAKKIYQLNPWLHRLPHFAFDDQYLNQYRIRSTNVEHSLSSLEAIAYGLESIEGTSPNNLLKLLNAFTVEFTKNMPANVQQRYK